MLTGLVPLEETGLRPTRFSALPGLIRSTEIWFLPTSAVNRQRPSLLSCNDLCEASPLPVPTPPAANGEPRIGVPVPSASRSKAPMVFTPRVLSWTYTCPTTPDVAEAVPAGSSAQADVRTSETPKRSLFISKLHVCVA